MVRITAYIKPHKLEGVKSAIAVLGVTGMNVSDVRGTGNSPETAQWFAGEGTVIALPIRAKVEAVVPDELREAVIDAILESAHTGEPGDGKIFVEEVLDAVRVRTGERGDAAV